MIVVVMGLDSAPADVMAVVEVVRTPGGDAFVSRGRSRTIAKLVGDADQFEALARAYRETSRSTPQSGILERRPADTLSPVRPNVLRSAGSGLPGQSGRPGRLD